MKKNENSYLRVVSIKAGTEEKTGLKFKTVTYQGTRLVGKREVMTEKTAVRNLYPATYERDGVIFKGSSNYDTIQVGDTFEGTIFTCRCTPFDLNGNWVKKWTGIVFGHEEEFDVAAKALKSNGSAAISEDEDGNETIHRAEVKAAAPKAKPELEDEPK